MEVPEHEVERHEYYIKASEWKDEEKREHLDARGRMWSAPVPGDKSALKSATSRYKDSGEDDEVLVVRQYHRAGEILARSMTRAGEYLGIRIKLQGEYKIGDSWQETH